MMHARILWLLLVPAGAALWLCGGPSARNLPTLPAADAPRDAAAADFLKNGVAFLEKHCVHCHGEQTKRADLALHVYKDEPSLIKDRKVWQSVLRMVGSGEMPPPKRPRPTADEVEAFTKAVNGVFERHDRNARPDPGRITVRRLNKAEYNNTIRDLVGVDFNPSEDFPSDDVGHGFDNIGDVLSLSPLLLEKYLTAAEGIAARAVMVEPPKPPSRPTPVQQLRPRPETRDQRVRQISRADPVYTTYRLDMAGEYIFRVRATGTSPDQEPPRLAMLLNDREMKVHEVRPAEKPTVYEAKVLLPPGETRAAVVLRNPTGGDKPRSVSLSRFELEGPLDSYPASHKKIMACSPDKPKAEQTREIVGRFASHAYRRPATEAEVTRLIQFVEGAEARGEKWEAGIRLAVQAALVSPKFLFRVELDDRPNHPDPHPIDEHQLASRLSYFLWSSMPDDELFELAGKKQLTANLEAQVRRMLKDPKAKALVENFALQWLQLRRLQTYTPDPKTFPAFNDRLSAAMLKETELFFEAVVKEDRSILDLLDADFTFLNEPLARHYGIIDTNGTRAGQKPAQPDGQPIRGEQFVRVNLADGERGGLLTQASVLTVTSNPTRTSPVKRGRWVLEQILGTPPPPPPPDVPELEEDEKAVLSGSLRQRLEQHRANPSCANCHARMDPLGFAFENYNAVGAFRARDGDFPIDPSGTLPDGKSFKGPAELKAVLKEKKDLFARCLAEKMLTYALGRGLEYYDKPAIDRITAALAKDDYRFSTLAVEIAKSDPFRLRRGKGGAQ